MDYASILAELTNFPDKKFCGGVSLQAIIEAQSALSVRFPLDYGEFLSKLGSGYVSSEEFIGLGGAQHLNVVTVASRLRQPSRHATFPPEFVPVRADGFGNYDCIDLTKSAEAGRSVVVLWVHDEGEHPNYQLLANGYWEWFAGTLKMIHELDQDEGGNDR